MSAISQGAQPKRPGEFAVAVAAGVGAQVGRGQVGGRTDRECAAQYRGRIPPAVKQGSARQPNRHAARGDAGDKRPKRMA